MFPKEIDKNNQLIRDSNFSCAVTQRSSLENLFNAQKCLYWSDLTHGKMYHIVSSKFFNKWRKFLQHPNTTNSPEIISNDSILCESHAYFLFPPFNDEYVGFDKKYFLLTFWFFSVFVMTLFSWFRYIIVPEDDWSKLNSYYQCSQDIAVLKVESSFELNPGIQLLFVLLSIFTNLLFFFTVFCEVCHAGYVEEEIRQRFVYSNATIFIRKVVNDEDSANNSDNGISEV